MKEVHTNVLDVDGVKWTVLNFFHTQKPPILKQTPFGIANIRHSVRAKCHAGAETRHQCLSRVKKPILKHIE